MSKNWTNFTESLQKQKSGRKFLIIWDLMVKNAENYRAGTMPFFSRLRSFGPITAAQ